MSADRPDDCDYHFGWHRSPGLLYYVGLFFVSLIVFKTLLSIWRGIYNGFLADALGFTVDWKNLGKWAVVTGGTDGIGKAYAQDLAARGFDIVLISRNLEKLKTTAEEIEKEYKVDTRVIAVDFTSESDIYDVIKESLHNLEIGVLVNNVGTSYRYPEYLTKLRETEKFAEQLIRINIISCLRMTQIVLPQMEQRRKGVILNISSLYALTPAPLVTMYSASKAWMDCFSRALQEEYRTKGIIIQSVLPGYVATNLSRMKVNNTTCTTPKAYVHWAMKTVGMEDRTYGYPIHKLQGHASEWALTWIPKEIVLSYVYNSGKKRRELYYNKKFNSKQREL